MNSYFYQPHWTAYVTALLTPVITIFGVYIAVQQWRTAQNKLKFDIFERRFSVYDAARTIISSISTNGKVKDEAVLKFFYGMREAKWLLNEEVASYLEKHLYHPIIELQSLSSQSKDIPVGDAQTKNQSLQAKIKVNIRKQQKELDRHFSPFLQLKTAMLQNHVDAWLDRVGNMVFIGDEMDGDTMNPTYYRSAIADHDRNHGLTEAAVWWM